MEYRLVKQDETISNIREKIKGFGSMLRFLVVNHEKKDSFDPDDESSDYGSNEKS